MNKMNSRQKKKKTKSLQTRYDDLYKKYQEAESNINALKILVASKDQVIIKQALLINMYRGHYGIGPFKEEKDRRTFVRVGSVSDETGIN